MNRVVITGLGVVSPLGVGREAFWSNLIAGRSGIGPIRLFDASAFPVRIGGEVDDFDAAAAIDRFPQTAGIRDRKVLLALAAAEEALGDAALADEALADAALLVGVGLEEFCLEDLTPYAHAADVRSAIAGSILDDCGDQPLQTPLDCTGGILGFFVICNRWNSSCCCVFELEQFWFKI